MLDGRPSLPSSRRTRRPPTWPAAIGPIDHTGGCFVAERRPGRRAVGLRARVTLFFFAHRSRRRPRTGVGHLRRDPELPVRPARDRRPSARPSPTPCGVRDVAASRAERRSQDAHAVGPHRERAASPCSISTATGGTSPRTPCGSAVDDLPDELRERGARRRRAATSTSSLDGKPYLAVGVTIAEPDAQLLRGVPDGDDRARPPGHRHRAGHRRGHHRRCSPAALGWWASRRLLAPAVASGRRRRASWRRAGSTPGCHPTPTPTSTGWRPRSTAWPTPCRPGSNARPGSPPTSPTSCAPPSPPSPPRSRCSTPAGPTSPTAASRRSTSSSTRSAASTRWCSTCSSCRASTPGWPSSTARSSCSSTWSGASPTGYGFGDVPIEVGPGADQPVASRQAPPGTDRGQPARQRPPARRRRGAGDVSTLRRETGEPTIDLAVEDAGPGVALSERTRIFERYARGTASRSRAGTGLGLALVVRARPRPRRSGVGRGSPGRRLPLRRQLPGGTPMRRAVLALTTAAPMRGDRRRRLRGARVGRRSATIGGDDVAELLATTTTLDDHHDCPTTTAPPTTLPPRPRSTVLETTTHGAVRDRSSSTSSPASTLAPCPFNLDTRPDAPAGARRVRSMAVEPLGTAGGTVSAAPSRPRPSSTVTTRARRRLRRHERRRRSPTVPADGPAGVRPDRADAC